MNKDGYIEAGYHIQEGNVPEAFCDEIVDAARAMRGRDYAPLLMPHRKNELFMSVLKHRSTVSTAEHLIGWPASGLGTEYFFGAPGTLGFTPHQDNLWVQAREGEFLHAWTALVDVDEKNGCMKFWPGSHKNGFLPVEKTGYDAAQNQNEGARALRVATPKEDPVNIVMKKGSTVFWNSFLIHASNDNTGHVFRHSVLCTYIRRGAKFNPGSKQKRTEIEL